MSASAYEMTSRDRDANSQRWIMIFVLLSLLVHVLAFLILTLINHLVPPPKLKTPEMTPATTITLQAPPTTPPPQRMFMQNDPDALAKPDPRSPIESDNNARLKSMSQTARDASSIMPDVVEKKKTPFIKNRPNAPSPKPDQIAPPPSPKVAPTAPKSATPPQPKEAKPTPPTPKPPEKAPPKPPPPKPAKNTVDPATGLPLLPPLDAPTLAPESAVPDSVPNPVSTSLPQEQSSAHGALGAHGDTSAAATQTEFGKYKAMVYHAVGSRWYPKVNAGFQVMPVGLVHVQFTIHSDGTVETKILEGNDASLQQLLAISVLSIQEAAPYPPFTDKLKQEIITEQGGDGESYTDDFTFSVYGQ